MATNSIKSGCGCGSGGGSCGCSGGSDCGGGTVCVDESFKRPQFFAGQLLTEDDLQALTNYVVGKNRLRNRYLFGDGVVCGLSVTCHPCGGEKVTVAPGYALDCCGNDILLPCKEELDVKALVRDLKQRQLAGYDCGDPCEQKDGSQRTYGLYLTYTETPDALVAPYSSSDPCGQQQCQPSRICEGYKFELRCDCSNTKRTDVFTRILACVGDLRSAASAVAKAQANQVMAQEMQQGLAFASVDEVAPFTAKSVSVMRETESKLALLDDVEAVDGGEAFTLSEREIREKAADYQVLMGAMTRFKSQPMETRERLLKEDRDLSQLVEKAEATLAASGPRLVEMSSGKVSDPAAKIRIEDNVRLAQTYAIGEVREENYQSFEAKMISVNAPVSTRQVQRMQVDAGLLKSWLLERLEGSASQTRCDLYDRTLNVRIGSIRDDAAGVDQGTVYANQSAIKELTSILIAYFVDCVCLALNPECTGCDDNAVLLACLDVEHCEVVDICNMSRRFVLSPTAMRYWLPPLSWIGRGAEWACCSFDLASLLFREKPVEQERDYAMAAAEIPDDRYMKTRTMDMRVEEPETASLALAKTYVPRLEASALDGDIAMMLEKTRLPVTELATVGEFSANLALLSSRVATDGLETITRDGAVLFDKLSSRVGKSVETLSPAAVAPAEDVTAIVKDEIKLSRDTMSAELKAEMEKELEVEREIMRKAMIEEVSKTVAKDVESTLKTAIAKDLSNEIKTSVASNVKSAVGKELTATKLRSAIGKVPTFKTLSADNRKLKAEIKSLSGKLAKMEEASK